MIKILADSTCDLSPELREKYDIDIIPLHIILDDEDYRDGVDITPDEIFRWSDEHRTTPKTAAVGMDEAKNSIKKHLDNGDEVIVIHISNQFSTTGNLFRMMAEELDENGERVSVVDSKNLSTGIALLVVEAAEMAAAGMSRTEIVDNLEKLIPRVRSSFVVDTLEYLHRGGRCSGVAAFVGGKLRLHPKILVKDGKMEPGKKYRGKMQKIILHYVKDLEEDLQNAKPDRVFLTHCAVSSKTISQVREYLKRLNHFDSIPEATAGGVISSHCGPGTLGVIYIAGEE